MDIKRFERWLKTPRDQIKTDPSKVGQAAHDILSHEQQSMNVEDVVEEYKHKYTKEIEACVSKHSDLLDPPFYIVVLHKKEFWAVNVLRNWFIARQTRPSAGRIRIDYPNHSQTVYSYDKRIDEIKLLWTLPTEQDCRTILANKQLYDPQLVKWIQQLGTGELDRVA